MRLVINPHADRRPDAGLLTEADLDAHEADRLPLPARYKALQDDAARRQFATVVPISTTPHCTGECRDGYSRSQCMTPEACYATLPTAQQDFPETIQVERDLAYSADLVRSVWLDQQAKKREQIVVRYAYALICMVVLLAYFLWVA